MSQKFRLEHGPPFLYGGGSNALQPEVHFLELRDHLLAIRFQSQLEKALSGPVHIVGKAEEIERRRLFAPFLCIGPGIAPELDDPRLIRRKFQIKLQKPSLECFEYPLRLVLVLDTDHEVVGISHDLHNSTASGFHHPLDPQVQRIVQVDVREYRGDYAALCKVNDYAK